MIKSVLVGFQILGAAWPAGRKQGLSRGKRENPGNEVGSFYSVISPVTDFFSLYVLFMRCFQAIVPFVLFIYIMQSVCRQIRRNLKETAGVNSHDFHQETKAYLRE